MFTVVMSMLTSLVDGTTGVGGEDSPYLRFLSLIDAVNTVYLVAVCVLCAYLVQRLFFKNTLGRHLGDSFDQGWNELPLKHKTLTSLAVFVALFLGAALVASGKSLPVSQSGVDLIVKYEVGGKSYYESRLRKPTVPAWRTTQSGVTIGFGFDVGYNSKTQIRNACEGILSDSEIRALQSVAGLKGRRAYYALYKVRDRVSVTWAEAQKIFERDSLPRFSGLTARAFNLEDDTLHPDCNGALVSLVFNRGSKVDYSDRRKEMAWIKHNISVGREDRVPGNIRSMKRLWSYRKLKGLHLRRDSEARLFEVGLKSR